MGFFDCFKQKNDNLTGNNQKKQMPLEQRRREAHRFTTSGQRLTETDGMTLSQLEKHFEVVYKSGKVIFSEKAHNFYQDCKNRILENSGKQGQDLIKSLKKVPFLKKLFEMKVGVWEGYTLEQHTSMVLGQFRNYQMKNWKSHSLTAEKFQLMLAIHDIGKPQAFQDHQNTLKQHEYNGRIVPKILEWLEIPDNERNLMTALTMQDHLGRFLRVANRMPLHTSHERIKEDEARNVAKHISIEARKIGVGVEEYFDLITCYYRADAGAYTKDAGGKQSLDFLFEEKTAPNCTREFAQTTQANYDILAKAVKSIARCNGPEFQRENDGQKRQLAEGSTSKSISDAGEQIEEKLHLFVQENNEKFKQLNLELKNQVISPLSVHRQRNKQSRQQLGGGPNVIRETGGHRWGPLLPACLFCWIG